MKTKNMVRPRRLRVGAAFAARRLLWLCGRGIVLTILFFDAPQTNSHAASPAAKSGDPENPAGYTVELAASEADVLRAVKDVAEDSIIHGTYVYEKEPTLSGALPADSSDFFGRWQQPGHVFYKVLEGAVAPRHFKNSTDIGTITVRYVVQAVNDTRTRLRVDAVFVEDARRRAHASDGTVELSEFKEIQEHLRQVQLNEQQAEATLKERQQEEARKANVLRQHEEEASTLSAAESSVRNLEQRLHDLEHDVELRVKEPGAELKSAPFHSAAKLQSLPPGTEVVILIITPYWYGVETPDSHRGWLRRDEVEPLP